MPNYESLSDEMTRRIASDREKGTSPRIGFRDQDVTRRRHVAADNATIWRPPFVHDVDKIIHCPYYSRYADKTQVFSLVKNDDITRRSLHVQLVSRIARTIGRALNLNLDLIEAIALGHDIGHAPFGHAGENFLDELYFRHAGKHFSHNIQSVRVLDGIFPYNISLQTLVGIAGHNGEIEQDEYRPVPVESFEVFDRMIAHSLEDRVYANQIQPSTLEGNVVRISDIIAYLGKDRQDAVRVKVAEENAFAGGAIGSLNAEIINNLVVNIIENSYGKPYIKMDERHFQALREAKRDNYALIYEYAGANARLNETAKPMMGEIYGQLLDDLKHNNRKSPIFTHHIGYVCKAHYERNVPYEQTEPNQLVVDYVASMTDDYLIDLHHFLFPNSQYHVAYRGYFDE